MKIAATPCKIGHDRPRFKVYGIYTVRKRGRRHLRYGHTPYFLDDDITKDDKVGVLIRIKSPRRLSNRHDGHYFVIGDDFHSCTMNGIFDKKLPCISLGPNEHDKMIVQFMEPVKIPEWMPESVRRVIKKWMKAEGYLK